MAKLEDYLEVVLQSTSDGLAVQDQAGNLVYANETLARLCHYPSGRALLDAPDPLQGILQQCDFVNESGQKSFSGYLPARPGGRDADSTKTILRRLLTATGEEKWLVLRTTPIFNETGRVQYIVSAFQDITEQKQVERRLDTQYRITQILADAATIEEASSGILRTIGERLEWDYAALWLVDQHEQMLRCVDTWSGTSSEFAELEAINRQILFAPDVGLPGQVWTKAEATWIADVRQDANYSRLRVAALEGLHGYLAFPLLLEGKVLGVFEFLSRRVRRPDERFLHMISAHGSQVGQFVKRKRAEEEVRAAEAKYRLLAEQIPAPTYIGAATDIRAVEYISPQIEGMLGYTPNEWIGNPELWRSRLHPDDREDVLAEQTRIDANADPFRMTYRMLARDGNVVWVQDEALVIRDEVGHPQHRLGLLLDITARKQAEDRLREKEQQYRSIIEATSDGLIISDFDGFVVDANPEACRMHGYSHEEMVGMHLTMLMRTDYRHLFSQYVGTVRAGEQFQTRAVDIRKDGAWVQVEIHAVSFTYLGRPHILAIVRDVTERLQAYWWLEQRVKERTRELSTLLEISRDVASMLELKPLLGLILNKLKSVVEYDAAGIVTLDEEDATAVDTRGTTRQEHILWLHTPLRRSGVIWERVFNGKTVIIGDIRDDTALAQEFREAVGEALNSTFASDRSWMVVPLMTKDRLSGYLTLVYSEPNYYTERRVDLTLAIASQATVAIENARLYRQAQAVAALEERQRLARELHDSVSQALYGIGLGAHTAKAWLDRDASRVAEPLEYVLSLAEAGLTEMRALIFELRPESLEVEGLVAALRKQGESLRARHGIELHAEFCDEPDLPLATKQAFHRIGQEAMHNIVKHARADRVELLLEHGPEVTVLTIRDNGSGFDPKEAFPGHMGLESMRERAESLGGELEVESIPDGGTTLRARIP